MIVTPKGVDREGDLIVVTAEVSGAFPGSPIHLGFSFRTAGEKIAALTIG
jgi:hypothetical protein